MKNIDIVQTQSHNSKKFLSLSKTSATSWQGSLFSLQPNNRSCLIKKDNMTIQEILSSTAVRSVEEQILSLYHEIERTHWNKEYENKKAIRSCLEVRKQILDSMFVLDEQNKQLMTEFNDALIQQLIEMRKRTISLYNRVYKPDMIGSIEVGRHMFHGL